MKKLNQTQIAQRLGISKSYLSMMLSGQRQIPDHLRSELCELNQLQIKPSKQAVAGSSPVSRSTGTKGRFMTTCISRGNSYKVKLV